MEATVEKLEAMFLKSEADLDYIERRLKLDFINSAAENGSSSEENVAAMLENLKAIKSKHALLCSEVREIAAAQKESMEAIRNNVKSVMEQIRVCHQTSDLEVVSLTESEQESAVLLGSERSPETAAPDEQQPQKRAEDEELSAAMLETVPLSLRSNVKLADLKAFHQQLQQHLSRSTSGSLSLQRMKQLKINASDAKLKILQHLRLVELDGKGHVRLVV